MKVLSLFDGISCGLLALQRAGIEVESYTASEVDKYAIKISKKNHPNIKHIGDVRLATKDKVGEVDLLIGGSPCQGFSLAGKRLNFDDPRSKLFFEFLRLLEETKPKYFLLENVRMKKEVANEITRLLDVEPIEINSSLVSAQNRVRLYWTNISNITQPKDKGIILKDILGHTGLYQTVVHNLYGGFKEKTCRTFEEKSPTIRTSSGGGHIPSVFNGTAEEAKKIPLSELRGIVRRLTPLECERLQTLPDGYTEGVSNTQRYKTIGNGWTVDVIAHIFSFI